MLLMHEDPAPMDVEAIGELVRLHRKHWLNLAYKLSADIPRAAFAQDPEGTVTELLRLAHLGASAEAELKSGGGGLPLRLLTIRAAAAWKRMGAR